MVHRASAGEWEVVGEEACSAAYPEAAAATFDAPGAVPGPVAASFPGTPAEASRPADVPEISAPLFPVAAVVGTAVDASAVSVGDLTWLLRSSGASREAEDLSGARREDRPV